MVHRVISMFSSVWRPIFLAEVNPSELDVVEFSKEFCKLRKILTCSACGQLLTNREVVSSSLCKEHFACKACMGKERDQDRKCENCEDWDTFESDEVIRTVLESYQSCCGYFLHCEPVVKQLEVMEKFDANFDAIRLIDLLGEGIKGMPIKRKLPDDMIILSDDDEDDDDDITCVNEIKRTKLSQHDDTITNSVNANTPPTTPSSSQSVSSAASTVTKICVDAETQTDAKEEFVKNTKEQEIQVGPSYKSFTAKGTQSMSVGSVVTKTITTNTHQGVASSGTVSLTPVPVPNPLPISTVKPVSKQIPSRVTTPVKHPVPVPAVSSPCRDIKSTISVSSSAIPTKQGATVVKTLLPSPSAQSTSSSSPTKQLASTSTTSISTTTVQIMPSKSVLTNAKLVASVSSTPATTKQMVTASPIKEVSKSSVSIPSVSKLQTPPVSAPSVSKPTAQTGTPSLVSSDTKDVLASSSSLVSTTSISTNNSKVVHTTSKIMKVEPPSTPPRASPSPEKITASPMSTPKTSPEKILIITSDIQNELNSARRSSGEPSPSPSEDVPPSPTKTSPSPTSLSSTPPLSGPSTPTSTTGSPIPMKFTSSFISSGLGGRGTQFLQIAQPGGGYKTVAISPQHLRLASNVALQGRLPGSIVPIQVVNSARLPKPSGAPTTGTETVRLVNASSLISHSTHGDSSTSSGSHGKAYITIQDLHRWPDPNKILQYASGDLSRLPLNAGIRAGFISMASPHGSSGLQGARFQTTPVGNIIRTSSASLGSLGSLVRPGNVSSAPTTNQTATLRNSQPQTLQIVRTTSLAGGAGIRPHANSVPTSTTILRQVSVSTASSNSPTIIVADPSSSITTSAALSSALSRRREGCRCGNAAANPGKLTCIGQRCACYAERNACSDCKCKGCKNPYLPGGKKVLHGVRALLEPQISQGIPLVATAVNPGDLGGTSATVLSGNGNGSTATVLTSNPSSNTVMTSSFGTIQQGAPPGATPPYQIIPVRFGLSGAPQYLQISNPHALQQIPIILSNSGQLQTASQAASGIAIQGIPISSLGAAGIHQISQARPTPTQLNLSATKPPE